jgi:hypothetical protein
MFFLIKIAQWIDERADEPRQKAAVSRLMDKALQQEKDATRRCEKPPEEEEEKDVW